ncbi:hypothetical protein ILUMI_27465, partial [Ignelater luminosus]
MESAIKEDDTKDCMMPLSSLTEQEDISLTEVSADAQTEITVEQTVPAENHLRTILLECSTRDDEKHTPCFQ